MGNPDRSEAATWQRRRPMRAITLSADVDREVNERATRQGIARSRIIDDTLRAALGLPPEATAAP